MVDLENIPDLKGIETEPQLGDQLVHVRFGKYP